MLFAASLAIVTLAPLPPAAMWGWAAVVPAGLAVAWLFRSRTEVAIVATIIAHAVFCLSIALAFAVSPML